MNKNNLRKRIHKLVSNYYHLYHKPRIFIPGKTPVPVSGVYYDETEMINLVDTALSFWLTEGSFHEEFKKRFGELFNCPYVLLVNSGSSANLLALSSLTARSLGKKALRPGDEVITLAASFPTTVNPIIQNNLIPVFIDIDLRTKNFLPADLEKAISKKTKAMILAHTLGNPFPVKSVLKIAKKYGLWLIEECCDALGSKYNGKLVGTFGDLSTFSFFAAHHITMGEGGAIVTKNPLLYRTIEQFKNWGRDCWCPPGKDNTCQKRFSWKLGKLPLGYDHKYTYSQIGYNLKITDMQAAVGLAQLKKLPEFIKIRKRNFRFLYNHLKKYRNFLILSEKEKEADPNWFGFMIVLKDGTPFTRLELVRFLESKKIVTRSLYAGNLLRHPAYLKLKKFRKVGSLKNSDKVMSDGFWIGVYPGITKEMLQFVLDSFDNFFSRYEKIK